MNFGDNAYIYLRKKILNWEWFTDVNTAHFFIYCLLKANWESGSWKGIEFERGEFIASLETIVNETGLTVQNIRTAIKHLISTQELTTKQHGKYRIFMVVKYDCYQQANTIPNKELTRNQQESNKEVTTDNKVNKEKEVKEVNKELSNDNSSLKASGEDEKKPYQEYIDLWNSLENLGIQPIRSISGKRLISFRARLKEHGKDSFTECIEQIRQSEFLQKSNFFKFDWIVCETNYPKVLEGKYSDKAKQKQSSFDADRFLRRFE